MSRQGRKIWLGVMLVGWMTGIGHQALAFDYSNWDALLKKYVAPKTLEGIPVLAVNYQGLGNDPLYTELIAELENAPVSALKSQEEHLVFWINAYNIMAVKIVLDHYPVKSVKDAGGLIYSVWKLPVGTVGGKERTLNEIEHDILRKMGDPRIHVAIVCASLSCPDLRPEAYSVERLHEQLNDQMKSFLVNAQKGLHVDESKQRIYLSSIFKWFADDFDGKGGVRPFLAGYAPEQFADLLNDTGFRVSYLDYNWNLNEFK